MLCLLWRFQWNVCAFSTYNTGIASASTFYLSCLQKNPQNHQHFICLKIRTSADPHFTGGLILSVSILGITKAIDKEKLPQLGYTTGRNSYWLANVARLLDAILTPGQRIERDLTYRRSCDRENDLLPILQNVTVTDTRHRYSSHSSHLSPTLVTDTRHTNVTSVGDEYRWRWRFAILVRDLSFGHKICHNLP